MTTLEVDLIRILRNSGHVTYEQAVDLAEIIKEYLDREYSSELSSPPV